MLAESIWIFKSGSCLTNVVAFFREINKIVDKGIMVDLTYLVISFKESKKSEDKRKRQKSAINDPFSQTKEIVSDVSTGFVLGPAVFPVLINGLEMRRNF